MGKLPLGVTTILPGSWKRQLTSTGKISNAVTSATCVATFLSADTPPKSDGRSGHILLFRPLALALFSITPPNLAWLRTYTTPSSRSAELVA